MTSDLKFTVDDAITLARIAHAGQTDKASCPHIEHPAAPAPGTADGH